MAKPATNPTLSLYNQILALGPKGYWPLRETSGTTVVDASGFGRNGTYSGTMALANTPGFDGFSYPTFTTSGLGTVPHHADFVGTGGMTVLGFARPEASGGWSIINKVGNGDSVNREWLFYSSTGTDIVAETRATAGATGRQIITGSCAQRTNWNMLSFTVANTTSTPVVRCNGAVISGSLFGSGTWVATTQDLIIGQFPTLPSLQTDGHLAHIAIFQRVLTPEEINSIYLSAVSEGWIFSVNKTDNLSFVLPALDDVEVAEVFVTTDLNVAEPPLNLVFYTIDDDPVFVEVSSSTTGVVEDEAISWGLPVLADVAVATVRYVNNVRDAILLKTPAGYWALSDASAPFSDSSGNGRVATSNFSPGARSVYGPAGTYQLSNSGTNTNLLRTSVVDNDAWTPGASGFTIFYIYRPGVFDTLERTHFSKGASGTKEWRTWHSTTQWSAEIVTPANAIIRRGQAGSGVVTLSTWHCLAVTFTGNTEAATVKMYKNSGTPLTITTSTNVAGTVTNGTGLLYIANDGTEDAFTAGGAYAHYAFFATALSDAGIQDLMTAAAADGWF